MWQISFHRRNEEGYIIIAAIMILALLTVIAVSALNMSFTEVQISTNELLYEKAFYAAEAGLEHLREVLKIEFVKSNGPNLAAGAPPSWSFAIESAQDENDDGIGDFAGGVEWINRTIDGITVQVKVWNNADDGDWANDTDGLMYARSEARGPRGAGCSIEILLRGSVSGSAITDYHSQQGAGPGKSYLSDDAEAMERFEVQLTAAR